MSEKTFQFKVGEFDCVIMKDGYREVSAEVFAGGVSEDERNSIMAEYGRAPDGFPLTVNIMVVNTGQQHILIDTGIGRDIGIGSGKLAELLASVDIQPTDIDLVVITHHHADHVGGITDPAGNLNFPKARYVISKTEWEFATNAENLMRMDEGMRGLVQLGLSAIEDRVELVEGEHQFGDGVRLMPAAGHTVGQMAVLLESGDEKLVHIADAAHHPLQVSYPRVTPTFDALPDVSPKTRGDLFQRACDEGMTLAAYHFGFPGLGYVVEEGDRMRWQVYGE